MQVSNELKGFSLWTLIGDLSAIAVDIATKNMVQMAADVGKLLADLGLPANQQPEHLALRKAA